MLGCVGLDVVRADAPFRAGAHVVDIGPTAFPVRVNAMFTERSATHVVDPLLTKALALDDGRTQLVFCLVDSCMLPRDLIDRAKAVLMQKHRLSEPEAYRRLRRMAMDKGQKLVSVAASVLGNK